MMGGRQQNLFGPKPRKPRRVMMRVVDAGVGDGTGHIVNFVCPRCGHDDGWWNVSSVSEGKRGIPCPKCNKERR